jgi:hypothetical protein
MSASFRLIHTTVFCLLLLCSVVDESAAQRERSPDSHVSGWLERGAVTNWSPSRLYLGCPELEAWQRRGIDLLFAAPLSAERTRDFAIAMTGALHCNDTRLNQWYFDRIDAAMVRSIDPASAIVFWNALEEADSPGIRMYLRGIMLDATKPESYRSLAGGKLFGKFSKQERLREYLALFETRQMPREVAVGITWLILQSDSENYFVAWLPRFGNGQSSPISWRSPGWLKSLTGTHQPTLAFS